MRRAARVDENQAAIIDALKRVGVSVEIIGKPLDLLIWSVARCPHCGGALADGKTELMEVKNPERTSADPQSRWTKEQAEFLARWYGKVHVVRTPEEAVRLVLGEKAMA